MSVRVGKRGYNLRRDIVGSRDAVTNVARLDGVGASAARVRGRDNYNDHVSQGSHRKGRDDMHWATRAAERTASALGNMAIKGGDRGKERLDGEMRRRGGKRAGYFNGRQRAI